MPKFNKIFSSIFLLISVGIFFLCVSPVNAATITRTCDAYYQWQTTGGSFGGNFGNFTGRGGCGSTVPNRCRERARDNALGCMLAHKDIRFEKRRPEACLQAAGVLNYNLGIKGCTSTPSLQCLSPKKTVPKGDLKQRLEVEVCCAFGKPNQYKNLRTAKNVHVRLNAVVQGGKKCGKKAKLFTDYVIKDCGAIWKNICRQGPGQPAK